jgi:hypothetical protein
MYGHYYYLLRSKESKVADTLFQYYNQFHEEHSPKVKCNAAFDSLRTRESSPQFKRLIEEYFKFHRAMMQKFTSDNELPLPENANGVKFLVADIDTGSGMGNFVMSASSVLVLAMLTKRVAIFNFNPNPETLFCPLIPGSNSSMRLPASLLEKGISWADLVEKSYSSPSDLDYEQPVVLDLWHNADIRTRAFLVNPNAMDFVEKHTYIVVHSNQYFMPGLSFNPRFSSTLRSWFPQGRILPNILDHTFLPRDEIWHDIKNDVMEYRRSSKTIIGIQIRLFGISFEESLPPILDKIELLNPQNPSSVPITLIVTSLNPGVKEFVKNHLIAIGIADRVNVIQPSAAGAQLTEDIGHLSQTLKEIWVLGLSDILVVSKFSTFGYYAKAIFQNTVFAIPSGFREDGGDRSIVVDDHPEPCYHFPDTGLLRVFGIDARSETESCPDSTFSMRMRRK